MKYILYSRDIWEKIIVQTSKRENKRKKPTILFSFYSPLKFYAVTIYITNHIALSLTKIEFFYANIFPYNSLYPIPTNCLFEGKNNTAIWFFWNKEVCFILFPYFLIPFSTKIRFILYLQKNVCFNYHEPFFQYLF